MNKNVLIDLVNGTYSCCVNVPALEMTQDKGQKQINEDFAPQLSSLSDQIAHLESQRSDMNKMERQLRGAIAARELKSVEGGTELLESLRQTFAQKMQPRLTGNQ